MAKKVGLLVEGGGMKCAFSAGVLDIFLDEGITADICYGISAGSANAASFLAGQRGRTKRFYCEHSKAPEYFGMKSYKETGSLFGLEYIYGELSKSDGLDPLDFDSMVKNPCEFVVVATDEYGKATYFGKEDMSKDHYEVIMASSALPAMCRPIDINGTKYFDGGVADSLPINKMIEDGCEKFIILYSKPKGYTMKPQGYRRMYSRALKEYPNIKLGLDRRHLNYNCSVYKIRKLEKEGKAFAFNPSPLIHARTTKIDEAVMNKLYDNGVECAKAKMYRLKEFLDK